MFTGLLVSYHPRELYKVHAKGISPKTTWRPSPIQSSPSSAERAAEGEVAETAAKRPTATRQRPSAKSRSTRAGGPARSKPGGTRTTRRSSRHSASSAPPPRLRPKGSAQRLMTSPSKVSVRLAGFRETLRRATAPPPHNMALRREPGNDSGPRRTHAARWQGQQQRCCVVGDGGLGHH